MKKVVILHSYNLTGRNPFDFVRVRYFLKGIEEEGYIKDKNLHIEMVDSNDLDFIGSFLEKQKKEEIDLIHAVGTPNAAIAANFTKKIPIVYYGAHPEESGKKECRSNNICGMVLTLPFTASYKHFRFTRKLLPTVRNIFVPYYEGTIFCPPTMKEKYRVLRRKTKNLAWVEMNSEYIGYRSLANLCYIIGLNYFEFVYRNIEELEFLLSLIEPKGSLIMPYNDSVYCNHAPEVLCEMSNKRRIPLIWNNNPEATQIGALAAIAACFKEAGIATGNMAGKILKGEKPSEIGFKISTRSYASINLNNAENFGLKFPADVLNYFDEVLSDGDFPRPKIKFKNNINGGKNERRGKGCVIF